MLTGASMSVASVRRAMPWLTGSEARQVERILVSLCADYPVVALLASGGFSVSMGNGTSDVDVIAIIEGGEHPHSVDYQVEERTCDIEFYTIDAARRTIGICNNMKVSLPHYEAAMRERPALRLGGRLRHAGDIITDSAMTGGIRADLDVAKLERNFERFFCANTLRLMRDAVGALDDRDIYTAAEASWQALWSAAESIMPRLGLTYMSDKYLDRRLGSCGDSPLREQVRVLLHDSATRGEDLSNLVADRLAVAVHCTCLSGLIPLAAGAADLQAYVQPHTGWRRTPGMAACWLDDAVVLGGRFGRVTPRAVAAVWALLEGRAESELVRLFAVRMRDEERASVLVRRSLISLEAAGLAEEVTV